MLPLCPRHGELLLSQCHHGNKSSFLLRARSESCSQGHSLLPSSFSGLICISIPTPWHSGEMWVPHSARPSCSRVHCTCAPGSQWEEVGAPKLSFHLRNNGRLDVGFISRVQPSRKIEVRDPFSLRRKGCYTSNLCRGLELAAALWGVGWRWRERPEA